MQINQAIKSDLKQLQDIIFIIIITNRKVILLNLLLVFRNRLNKNFPKFNFPDENCLKTLFQFIQLSRASEMLEDKIQHNLIKINQLVAENESIRYIVPLFFNAIKYIYDNCNQCKIDPALIQQVLTRFKHFEQENRTAIANLDQIHIYMMEQSIQMVQSRHVQLKVETKRPRLFANISEEEDQNLQEELIFLPQESYYLDEQFEIINRETSSSEPEYSKSNIIRAISLDEVPNFTSTQEDVAKLWVGVEELFAKHKLDEAYAQCEKFQNALFLYDPNCKLCQPKYDLIQKIHEEYDTMQHYYKYFDEAGYVFDKEEKGIRMFYKIVEQTKQVSVRVEAELEISIENFLCIVSEVDLFQEFVPFAIDTKQLRILSRNEKIGMTRIYIPLLSNREAFFYAAAYDRLKTHNSIFFYSKTISSDYEFQKKIGYHITKSEDLIELQYKFYIMEYVPIGENRGKVRLSTNIDLKLGFLPLFIINKSCRIFAFDYFKNLMKVNKHFAGSAWEKKMKENPEIYVFFKQRIEQYLKEAQLH